MPIPFILGGIAVVAGLTGLAKGGEAIANNSKAKEIVDDAQSIYNKAMDKMELQRAETTKQLNLLGEIKILSWSKDIGKFLNIYSSFKKVDTNNQIYMKKSSNDVLKYNLNSKQMKTASLKATEVLTVGVSSLGTGALAGIASYGGAMMFASASTGTAIATLSGAAATNATLAWFGGGSLAAGGLGMAGGTLVLGGIIAGPAIAVAGFMMASKSEKNLEKAHKIHSEAEEASVKLEKMSIFMKEVEEKVCLYEKFIRGFRNVYNTILYKLDELRNTAIAEQENLFSNKIRKFFGIKLKVDFRLLSIEQQNIFHYICKITEIFNSILSAPILKKNGELQENSEKILEYAEEEMKNILGVRMFSMKDY